LVNENEIADCWQSLHVVIARNEVVASGDKPRGKLETAASSRKAGLLAAGSAISKSPPLPKGGKGGFNEIATSPTTLLGGLLAMTSMACQHS
jgi:hypothetical protein